MRYIFIILIIAVLTFMALLWNAETKEQNIYIAPNGEKTNIPAEDYPWQEGDELKG